MELSVKNIFPNMYIYTIISGLLTLFPFFTIHAFGLGITQKEYGAITGVLPLLAIFAPIVSGGIADKIGNFKVSH